MAKKKVVDGVIGLKYPKNHVNGCDCEDCRRVLKVRECASGAKNHSDGCECEFCSKLRKWGYSHGGKTIEAKTNG